VREARQGKEFPLAIFRRVSSSIDLSGTRRLVPARSFEEGRSPSILSELMRKSSRALIPYCLATLGTSVDDFVDISST